MHISPEFIIIAITILITIVIFKFINWIFSRPNPTCSICGRETWYSAYGDGYYCEHGNNIRDIPSKFDIGKVTKNRMGFPIE